ncbi:alpha/beta hydrolase [Pseudoalteromonas rubra]|uniref:Alpha/beta hydrolase n=1 Tax=Pseudoalteromonas rubra TaxID=43658 RepID=A0A5S3WKN6_9GAMM|nr:alpha/beta fold hydrolase [Pseudoalteromonas rubra]TMP28152.1 alpha/beta hydrolase [Pseudoalteromonas rubra]TMP34853.1 alpha/beta hydrolase [Pseudoalteromonas rubra]
MLLNYKLSGQPLGSAEPVVLLHGLFGSLENLNIIARALGESYAVINLDLRNHGLSFKSDVMDYPSMAQDVLTLLEHLKIEKAHLVGHSMGGKVAMQVAMLDESKIHKLVVLDIAPVNYHPRHDSIIQALNAVASAQVTSRTEADTIMKAFIDEQGVRGFLLKSLAKGEHGEFNWRFNLAVIEANYDKIISNINTTHSCLCDTLFLKGNNSDYILAEHKDAIMQAFSNARAKIIQGAGHWLHAEKPQAVNRSIIDFIQ